MTKKRDFPCSSENFSDGFSTLFVEKGIRPIFEAYWPENDTLKGIELNKVTAALLQPNVHFDSARPAITAERIDGDTLCLSGKLSCSKADWVLFFIDFEERRHLGYLKLDPVRDKLEINTLDNGCCTLVLQQYPVEPHTISSEPCRSGDVRFDSILDDIAASISAHVSCSCQSGLRELRRLLTTIATPNGVMSQSQLVAHEISCLETELWLLGEASGITLQGADASLWPLFPKAHRLMRDFIELTEDLDQEIALDWGAKIGAWPSRTDLSVFRGLRAMQGESMRRVGHLYQ